ncbi:phosphatases II [Meredithblackwellia eburnea MCA 4105]
MSDPVLVDQDGDSVLLSRSPSPSASSSNSIPSPLIPPCLYSQRLGYTYFKHPIPVPDTLNNWEDSQPQNSPERSHWFTVDDQLLYLSFFQDSGPLNAACLYRFCLHVHTLLEDPNLRTKRIMLYSSDEPDKKANAALLIALYGMVVMRWSPADVLHPIAGLEIQPYRDAGYARADYHLSIQSTLYGIHRAISLHLLDLSTFDLASYECFEKVENGDWNWLTPNFIAFASPVEPGWVSRQSSRGGTSANHPEIKERLSKAFENVLEEFEKGGVRTVVRLNKKLYDKSHFVERGMEHVEMYFDDGTNPTLEMTRQFIDLSDKVVNAGGVVAVHCKAGLGRTGTLIGAYLIYKYGFTASEAIGFMRLMRPGSCVGPQQHYLYENQMTYVRWAAVDAYKAELAALSAQPDQKLVAAAQRPITPPNESELARERKSVTPGPVASTSQQPPTTPHGRSTVPRTPTRTGSIAVPGQPRKTPGKSKHAVATPEVRDEEEELATLEEEGKLNGLLLVPGDVDDEDGEDDPLQLMPLPKPPASPVKIRSGKSIVKSTRPTRIARVARPLSAIADNRIVDLGLGAGPSTSSSSSNRRTGGMGNGSGTGPSHSHNQQAKNVFEGAGGRYELRGGRTSPTVTANANVNNASPSRLPTRVHQGVGGAKKRLPGGPTESIMEVVGPGVGRSVRRRRSSLG